MKFAIGLFALVVVCSAPSLAAVQQRTVEYRHGDVTLKSDVFYDDAAGEEKRPGVLVIPEWWGINDYARGRARQLAEMGYVALAVDVYGDAYSTTDPKEAGERATPFQKNRQLLRERVSAALEQLRKHPNVDAARTAAIGYCFGGMAALELARSGADVAGVVSFHGTLATPNPNDANNIKARVLVLHGADDPFVPPEEVATFQNEMRQANVDWQMVIYGGGAVHAFTNPDAGKANMQGVAYNESADRRSWQAMKVFFEEIFKR